MGELHQFNEPREEFHIISLRFGCDPISRLEETVKKFFEKATTENVDRCK